LTAQDKENYNMSKGVCLVHEVFVLFGAFHSKTRNLPGSINRWFNIRDFSKPRLQMLVPREHFKSICRITLQPN
ncbi:MAG: hypothetical protein OEZ20_05525, partial [candidate division WOR-3 bacterium]|nr:hypothetical protein [candidate division WOR-3 bacterium]